MQEKAKEEGVRAFPPTFSLETFGCRNRELSASPEKSGGVKGLCLPPPLLLPSGSPWGPAAGLEWRGHKMGGKREAAGDGKGWRGGENPALAEGDFF